MNKGVVVNVLDIRCPLGHDLVRSFIGLIEVLPRIFDLEAVVDQIQWICAGLVWMELH